MGGVGWVGSGEFEPNFLRFVTLIKITAEITKIKIQEEFKGKSYPSVTLALLKKGLRKNCAPFEVSK